MKSIAESGVAPESYMQPSKPRTATASTESEVSESDRSELQHELLEFFKQHGKKGQDPEKAAAVAATIFPR